MLIKKKYIQFKKLYLFYYYTLEIKKKYLSNIDKEKNTN